MEVPDLKPELQIAFAERLREIEELHLGAALRRAVAAVTLSELDKDLNRFAGAALSIPAQSGLRGEVLFATPTLLRQDPRLLGYYRLLLGFSQKEFYKGRIAKFKSMEENGLVGRKAAPELDRLCEELCGSAGILASNVEGLGVNLVRDLQVLTLGAQLRGSRLNEIGKAAVGVVFKRVREAIPDSNMLSESLTSIVLTNAASRQVTISFSSDPDIAVVERLSPTTETQTLAIEVKGGTDVSNIHNRLGEAEKSHQKARNKGFREFWTIINVDVNPATAAEETPTTNKFFNLSRIIDPGDAEWERFRDELAGRLGLPAASR